MPFIGVISPVFMRVTRCPARGPCVFASDAAARSSCESIKSIGRWRNYSSAIVWRADVVARPAKCGMMINVSKCATILDMAQSNINETSMVVNVELLFVAWKREGFDWRDIKSMVIAKLTMRRSALGIIRLYSPVVSFNACFGK